MPPGVGPGGLPLPPHGPPPPLTPTKSQDGGGGSPGGVSPPTSSSALPPTAAPAAYPAHFSSGSLIQLSSGDLKPIEDLDAEDFLHCAKSSPEVQIDQSVVIDIVFRGEDGSNTAEDTGKKEGTRGTGDISDVAILKLVVGRHKIHVSTF